jgi:hypothetical protein
MLHFVWTAHFGSSPANCQDLLTDRLLPEVYGNRFLPEARKDHAVRPLIQLKSEDFYETSDFDSGSSSVRGEHRVCRTQADPQLGFDHQLGRL